MSDRPSNFIRDVIDRDNELGTYKGQVVTRFPPEPNGYLHIGHAKALCIDFGTAAAYGGRCHLRFDDTNPEAEDTEYVDAIEGDVRWLGFEWGEHLYYASDFFEQMYNLAEGLIRAGLAYVDSSTEEELRDNRGTVSEPGKPGRYRGRTVNASLDLFRRMRAGEFSDGAHVLRAKGDLSAANMKMRDPLLYRIRHAEHHRTGKTWCIYPMYDYAHPLEDALEGVTHSLCSLEFQDNREIYDWVVDNCSAASVRGLTNGVKLKSRPRQYEFARLNLTHTMMSKRKLRKLVEEGLVDGWDDPRMPTLVGFRRRGVRAEAIKAFIESVGVAKANSLVDMAQLEHHIRDDLNHEARRVMAVLDPLKVVIDNYPADRVEQLDASYWPHDVPRSGSRVVPFTRELYIERDDFMEHPDKGFKRLAPGREIRLRYGYLVTCTGVERSADGEVAALHCTYDPATRGGNAPDGRKVSGTIHWVSASEGKPAVVRLYDRLFTVEVPDAEPDWEAVLNPDSLRLVNAIVEPSLAEAAAGERFQFERTGYFVAEGPQVFNRTVALKDSWAKKAPVPETVAAPEEPVKVGAARELSEAEQAVAARVAAQGLSEADARTLATNAELLAIFDSAVAAGADPGTLANWVVNDVAALTKAGEVRFGGRKLAALLALIADGTISKKIAKDVLAVLAADGGEPGEIVTARGLVQVADTDALAPVVDKVIADNLDSVERYRGGNTKLLGFFVGQVMKATGGKANPKLVNELLAERLR